MENEREEDSRVRSVNELRAQLERLLEGEEQKIPKPIAVKKQPVASEQPVHSVN